MATTANEAKLSVNAVGLQKYGEEMHMIGALLEAEYILSEAKRIEALAKKEDDAVRRKHLILVAERYYSLHESLLELGQTMDSGLVTIQSDLEWSY